MRIQTLAAATLLGTAAMLPLATGALAAEGPDCTLAQANPPRLPQVEINRPSCAVTVHLNGISRPRHDDPRGPRDPRDERDRHEPRCADPVRDRIRHLDLDLERVPERLRDGGWPKDWPEDWRRDWRDCFGDPTDAEPAADDERPDRDGREDTDRSDDSGDSGADADESDDSSDDDSDGDADDAETTQVKIVPKGSVDTGDGSTR
jgi:hypothetical protein